MTLLTEQHMERLWQRMVQLYGRKWVVDHSDHDVDNIWLKGLQDLTPEMLAQGLKGCTEHSKTWPPTLMEFREYCLGLPDKALTKQLAIENKSTNDPFVIKMRTIIGSWNLSHCTYAELDRLAESAYKQAAQQTTNAQVLRIEHEKREALSHD